MRSAVAFTLSLLLLPLSARAADGELAVSAMTAAPPTEVTAALKPFIGEAGFKAVRGDKTVVEIWWCKLVPAPVKPSDAPILFPDTPVGSLWGVARISADWKDIKGQGIKPGVYTLRYCLQPADGDHLGASDFRDFLALVPADADVKPEALKDDKIVQMSRKVAKSTHPAVLMLRPHSAKHEKLPVIVKARVNEENLWIVETTIPCKAADGKAADQPVGVVLVGLAKAG